MEISEMIRRIRLRDPKGAEAFLARFGPLLRYVIAPILPQREEQEECLQEVALKVWERIERFDPERGNFTAWLTALAKNTALNQRRKLPPTGEPLDGTFPSPEPGPEERMLRQEQAAQLKRALLELSEGERNLFYRKYYYLQPVAQIAAELGQTERAVEGRLYRLRRKLKNLLGGERDE